MRQGYAECARKSFGEIVIAGTGVLPLDSDVTENNENSFSDVSELMKVHSVTMKLILIWQIMKKCAVFRGLYQLVSHPKNSRNLGYGLAARVRRVSLGRGKIHYCYRIPQ